MKRLIMKRVVLAAMTALVLGAGLIAPGVLAQSGISMSPMKQSIVLDPGEHYESSVTISNPGTSDENFDYVVSVKPFYVDEKAQPVFEENGDYSQIVDWTKITSPTKGSLEPNETREVYFSIDVPEWAPGGGQYAAISVSSDLGESGSDMTINEEMGINHVIYAEVTGNTVRTGEITDASVPSFLFSGNIKGASEIKNDGNVHGTAQYTLKVYPLFSNEELYTNEEKPETAIILPDRTLYYESEWEGTPMMGIFNVVYNVEFEGVKTEVTKMVIKCPVWLLFIILAAIAAIVIWIVLRVRSRGKKSSKKTEE